MTIERASRHSLCTRMIWVSDFPCQVPLSRENSGYVWVSHRWACLHPWSVRFNHFRFHHRNQVLRSHPIPKLLLFSAFPTCSFPLHLSDSGRLDDLKGTSGHFLCPSLRGMSRAVTWRTRFTPSLGLISNECWVINRLLLKLLKPTRIMKPFLIELFITTVTFDIR